MTNALNSPVRGSLQHYRYRRAPYCELLRRAHFRNSLAQPHVRLLPEECKPWVVGPVARLLVPFVATPSWERPRAFHTGLMCTYTQGHRFRTSCAYERGSVRSHKKIHQGFAAVERHLQGCGLATSSHLSVNDHVLNSGEGR